MMLKRFFSDSSFWNTPLPKNPEIDPSSNQLIELLGKEPKPGFWINLDIYTIPVYEINASTPLKLITPVKAWSDQSIIGHGKSFENPVPIPENAKSDPGTDHHLALIDYSKRKVWDLFGAQRRKDGEWESVSGMTYPLDGKGEFDKREIAVKEGESIHRYGPCRAAGVPIVAGLIMQDEVMVDHRAQAGICDCLQCVPAICLAGNMD